MSYLERITVKDSKPCIRGLHITVDEAASHLKAGTSVDGVLKQFPGLEREDVFAAMQYTAVRRVELRNTRRLTLKISAAFAVFFVLTIVASSVFSPHEPHWFRLPAIYVGSFALTYAGIRLTAWLSKELDQN